MAEVNDQPAAGAEVGIPADKQRLTRFGPAAAPHEPSNSRWLMSLGSFGLEQQVARRDFGVERRRRDMVSGVDGRAQHRMTGEAVG